jgi:purine-nucleoside phosphorylase
MAREVAGGRAGAVDVPSASLAADAAVVFGSGLAVVPAGAVVERELAYADLGWPALGVAGHAGRLLVAKLGAMRVLLAGGRPHLYEGWSPKELTRPVDDLAAWGVRRLVLTNACGGLSERAAPGTLVVVDEVVDLQTAPPDAPQVMPATSPAWGDRCVERLASWFPVVRGRYVAVPGPQYETPAEARWLAGYGDAVGMSTAPEVRAAREHGLETAVLALVVNRSGAALGHEEVLTQGQASAARLREALPAILD